MKTSRWRRRLLVLLGLVALFTLVGFFLLPPLLKSQLERRLSAELGRRVTVEKVRLNPYALSLALENFAIREATGDEVFLRWRRLYANFDALRSLRGAWTVSEIALDGFESRLAVRADGSLSISDILAKLAPADAPPPAKKPARPLRIVKLQVSDARVEFSDASRGQPFASTMGPVSFALTEFRTGGGRGAPYRFEAVTESGERLVWLGTIQAEPFVSRGELTLENIVLAKYAPYYASLTQADLLDGKLSLRGRYELDLGGATRVLKLSEGALQLRSLQLAERATGQNAVELPAIDIAGIQADAIATKLAVDSVTISGGHIRVRREKDGALNLLRMLQPASPPAPAAAAAATPPPTSLPELRVGEFALQQLQVDIADLAAPRPAQLGLRDVQVSLKNITLAEGARMPLQLSFDWAPRGTVKLEGDVTLSPIGGDVRATVADFDLLPLSPYAEQFVNARITQGALSATIAAQVALPATGAPTITAAGDLTVSGFGVVDSARNEELAGLSELALHGIQATTAPSLELAIQDIKVAAPYARVVMNADKTLNLATVIVSEPATPAKPIVALPAPANAPPAPPKISVGTITIDGGDYRFTDRSVQPNVSMAITDFGGTVAGLSSANVGKADLDLKALVDGAGPIAIKGKIDPLATAKHFDLTVDFRNVDLVPLSPYAGKYAGFELARGKLALDVKLLVDGRKIDSANVVTLHQFTFGNPVQSPEATSLPVRLGVALLKDSDGKIVIDVPVQGSTDDPSFRVGRVVLRVITNLLTKVATSPFALLGAAFGGGEEMSFQEFAAGSAEIRESEAKKLETLARAMTNRPALNLSIEGSYDTASDVEALKQAKLADAIRRSAWERKRLIEPNIAPPEKLVLGPEETAAATQRLFDAQFPPGTELGNPLPPPAPVVTIPAPERPGVVRRVWNAVTFQNEPTAREIEAENARAAAAQAHAAASQITLLPVEEMNRRLLQAMPVDEAELRSLAQARAQRVRDYLATTGKIAPERLFLANSSAAASSSAPKGARVSLTLQ